MTTTVNRENLPTVPDFMTRERMRLAFARLCQRQGNVAAWQVSVNKAILTAITDGRVVFNESTEEIQLTQKGFDHSHSQGISDENHN